MLASQIKLITPAEPTAWRFVGAAGGKVSRGVTQIGSDGSLSIAAVPTAATLRTTKHCSLPRGRAVVREGQSRRAAVGFSGTGAVTGAAADPDPAAGTA